MDEKFDKWDKRFIDMAQLVSTWSSCFQTNRQVGAVIVKNKRVMTTGYNGAASGIKSCKERGSCCEENSIYRAEPDTKYATLLMPSKMQLFRQQNSEYV